MSTSENFSYQRRKLNFCEAKSKAYENIYIYIYIYKKSKTKERKLEE